MAHDPRRSEHHASFAHNVALRRGRFLRKVLLGDSSTDAVINAIRAAHPLSKMPYVSCDHFGSYFWACGAIAREQVPRRLGFPPSDLFYNGGSLPREYEKIRHRQPLQRLGDAESAGRPGAGGHPAADCAHRRFSRGATHGFVLSQVLPLMIHL